MSHLGSAVRRSATALVVAIAMVAGMATFAAGTATAGAATSERGVVGKSAAGKITSTITGKTSTGDKVTGKFTPIKAIEKDGGLAIKGFLQGVITDAAGKKTHFSGIRTIPVKKINGSAVANGKPLARAACNILSLDLGPLDLNILGLRIQLNKVELDITAVPGAGNLLGNLLCAVAGLLDGGPLAGLLGQLRGLLNQILAALNLGV